MDNPDAIVESFERDVIYMLTTAYTFLVVTMILCIYPSMEITVPQMAALQCTIGSQRIDDISWRSVSELGLNHTCSGRKHHAGNSQ